MKQFALLVDVDPFLEWEPKSPSKASVNLQVALCKYWNHQESRSLDVQSNNLIQFATGATTFFVTHPKTIPT